MRSLISQATMKVGFLVPEGRVDDLPGSLRTEKVSNQPEPSEGDFSPASHGVSDSLVPLGKIYLEKMMKIKAPSIERKSGVLVQLIERPRDGLSVRCCFMGQ